MRHSGNELINPFKTLERAGIREGDTVADLGCGALGHFVFPAAQLVGGNGRVYAVDIDKNALKAIDRAAKHDQYFNITPVWSDIEVVRAARIRDGSCQLVIVAGNLYLSRNRAGLVAEAMRLLAPGGAILMIEWQACVTDVGPAPENRMPPHEAKRYFADPELELTDEYDAGDCHYALVYRKRIPEGVREEIVNHADDLARR
ncbi:class I SAM-dependent methyltransferase [Patescibacteria group bacterium]|jgi:ubiquinone/menaquinone biosynthesis C-methylase UbiE|nr:class I SAM-dependent methyltransferase [Patescibacteria group bacterium]